MKEELLSYIDDILKEEGITEEELILLNIIYFIVQENEFDDEMITEIMSGIEQYLGGDEEVEFTDEEYVEEEFEDMEEGDDFDGQLVEAIVKKIRGGKIVKVRQGYGAGGKKISSATKRKLKIAAKKRARKPVKASTIKKRMKSRARNAKKFKTFLNRKRKK